MVTTTAGPPAHPHQQTGAAAGGAGQPPPSGCVFVQPQHPRPAGDMALYSGHRVQRPLAATALHHGHVTPAAGGSATYDGHGNLVPPAMALVLGRRWLANLCECFHDVPVVVETAFCPYCQIGYQFHRTRRAYIDMDATVCLGVCCVDLFTAGAGYAVAGALMRDRIVRRYHLEEPASQTIFFGCCCAPCTICQVHREMKLRGEFPGGVCIDPKSATAPLSSPPAFGHSMGTPASSTISVGSDGRPPPYNPEYGRPHRSMTVASSQHHHHHLHQSHSSSSHAAAGQQQRYYSPTSLLMPHGHATFASRRPTNSGAGGSSGTLSYAAAAGHNATNGGSSGNTGGGSSGGAAVGSTDHFRDVYPPQHPVELEGGGTIVYIDGEPVLLPPDDHDSSDTYGGHHTPLARPSAGGTAPAYSDPVQTTASDGTPLQPSSPSTPQTAVAYTAGR